MHGINRWERLDHSSRCEICAFISGSFVHIFFVTLDSLESTAGPHYKVFTSMMLDNNGRGSPQLDNGLPNDPPKTHPPPPLKCWVWLKLHKPVTAYM